MNCNTVICPLLNDNKEDMGRGGGGREGGREAGVESRRGGGETLI